MTSLVQSCCLGRLAQCGPLVRGWSGTPPQTARSAFSCTALLRSACDHRRPAPIAGFCSRHGATPAGSAALLLSRSPRSVATLPVVSVHGPSSSTTLLHSSAALHTSSLAVSSPLHRPSQRRTAGQRWSSSDAGGPDLMAVPRVVFPTVLKTLRRWFLVTFVIRPYLDHGFTMQAFMTGARQAMLMLSDRLSRGDLASLKGLVTPEALAELERSVPRLSLKQRSELRLQEDTIGPFMACEVGMIIEEEGDVQRRWVEITVCAHVHPAFARVGTPISQMEATELTVCNYRFIRDYTRGAHDTWTVNLVNHFKPFTRDQADT